MSIHRDSTSFSPPIEKETEGKFDAISFKHQNLASPKKLKRNETQLNQGDVDKCL